MKIKLKPITEEDKEYFLETYNNDEVLENMEHTIHIKPEWYHLIMNNPTSIWMVIMDGESKIGLFNSFFKQDKPFFGIIIQKDKRRQGAAREAIRLYHEFIDHESIDCYLQCFDDNPAKSLYEEMGYKRDREYKTIRNRKFVTMIRRYK